MEDRAELEKELQQTEEAINRLRVRLAELQGRYFEVELRQDYRLLDTHEKEVPLSSLFSDTGDLIVVHNMGRTCPYCTMWADGFSGLSKHLNSRAAFVLVSPDPPDVLKAFSEARGWTFRVLSASGSTFTRDMGFQDAQDRYVPGVSAFYRDSDGRITRTSAAFFGPGDAFCPTWHFFELLKDGPGDWQPRFAY